ncbi:hypothetical protein [Chryseobacterium indoltheticum]|uniref:hypothetical protein n=1 Tax=Chryseobacterium indoltheticum TaxID=254 RepID=UPI003F495C08
MVVGTHDPSSKIETEFILQRNGIGKLKAKRREIFKTEIHRTKKQKEWDNCHFAKEGKINRENVFRKEHK